MSFNLLFGHCQAQIWGQRKITIMEKYSVGVTACDSSVLLGTARMEPFVNLLG